ncbi:SEC-C domain-containing protein [Microcoleus sp. LAD1_D5]|uniref:SEC-C domain-containing protein n=1 Tax=unclassified Microcoleus TaxID=2642155 RepID=UPI002FCF9D58
MNKLNQLSEIRKVLNNFLFSLNEVELEGILIRLAELKSYFIAENNQKSLKEIWCLEKIIAIKKKYVLAFSKLKSREYYEAWCLLEEIEIYLSQLFRHLKEEDELFFLIVFIEQHSLQYQSLFPYSLFASPEFTVKDKICSICHKKNSIRHSCGHKNGEIYDGKMCYQIWEGIEFVLLAIVEFPVQKFSVFFLSDPNTGETVDHYDYGLLEYLMDCLQSPFHFWGIHNTTISHPHSNYLHIEPDDYCPCGSGKKYNHCCLLEAGVLQPHCELGLSVPPPKDIEKIKYPKLISEKKVKASAPAKNHTLLALSDYLVQTAKGDFVQIKL